MVSPVAEPHAPTPSKTLPRLQIQAGDPRSDNRRRGLEVEREAVVIRREVAGIPMAIRILLSAYRGVTLRIGGLEGGRFHYEVKLLHLDLDLCVPLAEGEDEAAAEFQWREWVRFLGLPAFVGRTASADVQVNIDGVDVARRAPNGRRRGGGTMGGGGRAF
jgi:Family of unknown function (DUF6101)